MEAIYRLAWLKDMVLAPVNWRDMETEELGSVYESLLELTPRLIEDGRGFAFAEGGEAKGHARKTTGSYYTPDSLVQALLDTALEPVLSRVEAEADDPSAALLSVTVLDPACGSGHFLLAAARRIATRLARARAGGVATPADYRRALRDVARACIHGVDRNPMAVELTKVALWIETVEPGKPLGFLDANIRCGDALLGVFDLKALEQGIPDDAYNLLSGDDKDTARHFAARNKAERAGQGSIDFAKGAGRLPAAAPIAGEVKALRAMPEDSPDEISAKRKRYETSLADSQRRRLRIAADLYMTAFLAPKVGGVPANRDSVMIPTTAQVWDALAGRNVYGPLVGRAQEFAAIARVFHWPLEFPDILAAGGFDIVLGNPPWDAMSPDVKEFFSKYDEQVRFLSPTDQKSHVASLLEAPGVRDAWDAHCRHLYVSANFMRESGRYKLFAEGNLGKGDFNVYRMFVELALFLVRAGGRAAQLVPENLYNGANAAAIRQHLFEKCRLHALIGFENTKKVWFDIDSRAKFCLYSASPGARTETFPAAFGINSVEKLLALRSGLPFDIPVSLVVEFSPEALAIAEVAHAHDITISRKIYARYPKFGADVPGLAVRDYMREVDMGNDRDDFESDPSGLPVYEGRMVEAYDHRAKAYISGRGRKAVWTELAFGSEEKRIRPQWRLASANIPPKRGDQWRKYRLGFCDVASPTNQRAFVCALIPPLTICGDKVPTLLFSNATIGS
jgi:N-6 DNA Methylase